MKSSWDSNSTAYLALPEHEALAAKPSWQSNSAERFATSETQLAIDESPSRKPTKR